MGRRRKMKYDTFFWISNTYSKKRVYCVQTSKSIEHFIFQNFVAMSSDSPISARTERVLAEFREAHDGHAMREELFRKSCPFCQSIVEEQITGLYETIRDVLRPSVFMAWKHWDANGYPIANNGSTFEEFLGDIAYAAFAEWAQPKYEDNVEFTDEELMEHPYVRQKIRE
jgi:hypothetical protein